MFPGKEKFETDLAKESWPNFNTEFEFPANGTLDGKFVSLTAYAVLYQNNGGSKKSGSFRRHLEKLTGKQVNDEEELKRDKRPTLKRQVSLNNRRTIGVATYNLDYKCFTQKLRNGCVATPDVWRTLEQISSGMEVESVGFFYGGFDDRLTFLFVTCRKRAKMVL